MHSQINIIFNVSQQTIQRVQWSVVAHVFRMLGCQSAGSRPRPIAAAGQGEFLPHAPCICVCVGYIGISSSILKIFLFKCHLTHKAMAT